MWKFPAVTGRGTWYPRATFAVRLLVPALSLCEIVLKALVGHGIMVQIETPLVKAETLSEQLGNNIMLKREDLQVG